MLTEMKNVYCGVWVNQKDEIPFDADRLNKTLRHASVDAPVSWVNYAPHSKLCLSLAISDPQYLEGIERCLLQGCWKSVDIVYMSLDTDEFLMGYRFEHLSEVRKHVEFGKCQVSFYIDGSLSNLRPKDLSPDGFFFYHGRARSESSEDEGTSIRQDRCVQGVDSVCPPA